MWSTFSSANNYASTSQPGEPLINRNEFKMWIIYSVIVEHSLLEREYLAEPPLQPYNPSYLVPYDAKVFRAIMY